MAFYGANITAADLEAIVYELPALTACVDSFMLIEGEDARTNKTLILAFELREGADPPPASPELHGAVLERLAAINQDYREAARMIPPDLNPSLAFHPHGSGPFADFDPRVKRQYIARRSS